MRPFLVWIRTTARYRVKGGEKTRYRWRERARQRMGVRHALFERPRVEKEVVLLSARPPLVLAAAVASEVIFDVFGGSRKGYGAFCA